MILKERMNDDRRRKEESTEAVLKSLETRDRRESSEKDLLETPRPRETHRHISPLPPSLNVSSSARCRNRSVCYCHREKKGFLICLKIIYLFKSEELAGVRRKGERREMEI